MSILDIKDISIQTKNAAVVHNTSFRLESGEMHVLMGPNGSGKSTIVNALFGNPEYKITKGTITLDGKNILVMPTEKKAQAGLFLSMQYLPEISGVTLTSFLHKAYRSLKNSDISIVDFYSLLEAKAKELDIDTGFLSREVNVGLSGGEKKLTEVLQLAVLEPKFAFLDEIDSGVDVDSLRKVFKAISVLQKQGTGFFLITHYNAILDHITPDYVHVIKEGCIVRSGGKELVKEIVTSGFDTILEGK
ncbi:MAG: Fe-S cluster assembly ATPase SufC [Candidatus Pacebacteria bacterium]|nr:Fe-S cluster assembly ATPase SufC [Candidatus Paceibacterota bacterium]